MPRQTTKEAKQKARTAKGRMNEGGATMPGKASARAQAQGMEKDTRARTGDARQKGADKARGNGKRSK